MTIYNKIQEAKQPEWYAYRGDVDVIGDKKLKITPDPNKKKPLL